LKRKGKDLANRPKNGGVKKSKTIAVADVPWESEKRYRLLIERQKDGLCIVDLEERFVFCNPAGEEIFGVPRGGLVGRNVREFTTPETFDFIRKQTAKRRSGETSTYELEIIRPNGARRRLHTTGTPWLNKEGRVVATLAIFRDETNRKRADEALKGSDLKYRRLFENVPHGIYQNTPDGRILTANPALVRMLGYDSESELLAADIARDLYVNPDDRKAWMRRLEEGGELRDAEIVLKRKNGQELVALDSGHVVRDEQGRILYYEGTVTDITERKGMEAELRRRAQELNALQETVLDITGRHDLPTVLNSIVERAARLLGAPSGGMYLCDPERREVRCVVGYNTITNPVGTVLKYGEGAAGIVAETSEPLIIDDYRTWTGRAAVFERDQPFSTVLSVPMIWQGQVAGVIHAIDNKETRRFTQADLELLSTFADHAAVAVENARLLEQEQHHAEELTRYSTNLEQQVLERTSKLAESERRFRELVDLLPQIVFEIDEKGNLTFLNDIAFASTGYSEDDVRRGLNAFQMFAPEDHDRARQKIRKLLGGEKASSDEYTVLRKDGSAFPAIVYAAAVMRENRAVGVRGIVVDITERKRAEEALRVSEDRFRGIAERIADIILDVDLEGGITYVSPSVEPVLGYKPEEMKGTHMEHYLPQSEISKMAPNWAAVMQGKRGVSAQGEMLRKDGTRIAAEMNASPILKDGRIVGVQGVIRDIRERRRMEERLVKSERLAAIGETAAMVGHDLRNPLQGIAGAIHLLRAGSLTANERDEMLQLIQSSVEYSDSIVRDLSEYSAEIILELALADTTPKSLTREAIQAVKVPPTVSVQDLSQNHPTLKADTGRIKRALVNLIQNAIDAMPQGGTLTISSKQSNGDVEIALSDTGSGMPERVMESLWKPLQTTKAKGLGLGLAICKRIVDAHGGTISVKSKADEGTTVTIGLPIKPVGVEVKRT